MNGRQARLRRRAELPADLRAEANARIAVAASARSRARAQAKMTYLAEERGIARDRHLAEQQADVVFERAKSEILAEFARRAQERSQAPAEASPA